MGWSRAKFKRAVALARLLGVGLVFVRREAVSHYKLGDAGPIDLRRCRALWRRRWL
jgi:hypothetical protein